MAKTTQKADSKKTASKTAAKTSTKAAPKTTGKTASKTAPKKTASKASAKTTAKKAAGTSAASKNGKTASKTAKTAKTVSPAAKKSSSVKKTPSSQTRASKISAERELIDRQIEQSNREIYALLQNNNQESNQYEQSVKNENNERKEKAVRYGILAAVLLAVILLLILCVKGCSTRKASGNQERQNTISLAKKYIEKGQLDPAMELLNRLLISDADDEEVNRLLDELIELKAQQERDNSPNFTVINPQAGGSYDINIDTDSITNAFRDTIDSMSKELSAANAANAKSQDALNRLLEQQRQDELERKEQAKALEQQKKEEEAKRKAEEEQLAKENKQLADKIGKINDLIKLGNASLNTGNSPEALKQYQDAVKLLPVEQGEPKFSGSKYAEIASNLYDAAEREKSPQTKTVLMQNAVEYAQKAIEKDPSNARAHFILAMNAETNKEVQEAERQLELAVKNDPNNYLYYYYLGRRQQLNGKFQQARSSYTSSIKLKSDFDSAHFNLGLTCNKLNLQKDALASFRRAYAVNPQHAKAYLEEARLLNRAFKDLNGAVNAYSKVLNIEPDNMNALKECGSVYAELGNYQKSEELFRRVVAKLGSTPDPMTYYNLSTVLYNQNKIEDSLKYAKIAYDTKDTLKSSGEKAMVTYQYALATEKAGDKTGAIAYYREVLTLNPSHTKAKTNLGIMFMEMNPPDVDTALTFLNGAYQEDKNNFEVNNNLGNAYLLKKDYSSAVNYYLNASKLKPKDVEVKKNLAKAYAESGELDNAKVTYIEVINLNSNSYDSYIEVAKVCIALHDTVSAEGYLTALQNKKPEYRTSEVKSLLETVRN